MGSIDPWTLILYNFFLHCLLLFFLLYLCLTNLCVLHFFQVGVQLGEDRRRLSRVLLTELNVAQLQVVANDLHARIAALNEALVEGLLRRDDLHMEQDSMLVDVEDLTRYL